MSDRKSLTRLLAVAAFVALGAAGAPALAQGELENTSQPFDHQAAGVTLPYQAGNFTRTALHQFDSAAEDIAAVYRLQTASGNGAILSLYVYPVRKASCRQEFDSANAAIQRADGYGNVQLVSAREAAPPQANAQGDAYYARYTMSRLQSGADWQDTTSDAYLFCPAGDRWLVKYRLSWNGAADDMPSVQPLFDAMGWSDAALGIVD